MVNGLWKNVFLLSKLSSISGLSLIFWTFFLAGDWWYSHVSIYHRAYIKYLARYVNDNIGNVSIFVQKSDSKLLSFLDVSIAMFVQFCMVKYIVWHIIVLLARSLVFINQKTKVLVAWHYLSSKFSQAIVLGISFFKCSFRYLNTLPLPLNQFLAPCHYRVLASRESWKICRRIL